MKKFLTPVLIILLLSLSAAAFAETPDFTERVFPVIRNIGRDNSFTVLRFYESMPNVAYISAAEYLRLWDPDACLQTEQTGPSVYELTSPSGKAVVDTEKNTFASADFGAFTNLMGLVREGVPNIYYDGMPFIRYESILTEPPEAGVFFDFGSYHMELFGDRDAVYFPFALISDLYSDLFYHHSGFNGQKVVLNYSNFDMTLTTVDPSYAAGLVSSERPEDLVSFTYNELCFAIDHFYGQPGRELVHDLLGQGGLDQTLDAFGETGKQIKTFLQSQHTAEFFAGLDGLNKLLFDGGHTSIDPWRTNALLNLDEAEELYEQYEAVYQSHPGLYDDISQNLENSIKDYSILSGLYSLRNRAYGPGETYIKQGSTAICVLNSFDSRNQEAWDAYYAGEGPLPTKDNTDGDTLVIFLDALYRAQADPDVRNLVIDVSTNTGGSADVALTIASLITGKSMLRYENVLTGQKSSVTYSVDRNFDGVYDERDAEVSFDLNFAVLTGKLSFSCANLFASILHDAGCLILGEKSRGGACAVAFLNTAGGYDYSVSSYRTRLINAADEVIDFGIPADIELADHNKRVEVLVSGFDVYHNPVKEPMIMDDYRSFYDPALLDRLVTDYYTNYSPGPSPL